MSQPFRLADRGRIDRTRRIAFRFDGRALEGHPGDTLASALLANGIHLVARSFKYHRPRGILAAGVEEPNALVELRRDARREPNTRVTQIELHQGLTAQSQSRWPSLRFDLQAINSWFAPIFVGGFYYKTFMWPAAFWEPVYERLIRRASGLGRAARAPDPDAYENCHLHCDVLVVGAGPAGLMAARAAGASGARVVLCDENPGPGGWLLRERVSVDGAPASTWLDQVEAELAGLPEVRVFRRTTVFGFYDHNVLAAVERANDHVAEPPAHQPRQRMWTIRANQVVIAAGSHERPLVFAGNDRPGVMLASAVRAYLNQYGVLTGNNVVVVTNNDDAYRTAIDLVGAGVRVPVIADARSAPGPMAERAQHLGIEVRTGTLPLAARGGRRVRALELVTTEGEPAGDLACDCIAMSGGFNPAVHLASQSGPKPVWRDDLGAFVPGEAIQRERSAGAARGVFELRACLEDGARAGTDAARAAGFADAEKLAVPDVEAIEEAPIRPIWNVPDHGKAFVDFQNDVTVKDIELAHQEGYVSIEHTKRYTTLGMATDQGKTANVNGLAILARLRGEPIPAVGTTTFRPPYTPVAIGSFAGPERGLHFQPNRRTAMHTWHEHNGAVFVEAGQWLRPQYYPRAGELEAETIARETHAVRQSVGLCDVSTLGKIDVFGPDAAEFLNRLYVNGFKTLAVGRARYGLMLREDGHVYDDGTTSRLADDHFFMTTTTANAAGVLAHMEYYHRCVWPELDVAFCSATEQWCGMALAGPNARKVLERVVDNADVSNRALPFMGVLETTIDRAPARIFRISFSGELGYEINVPWGHGIATWEQVIDAGSAFDITPYGTEALGQLRLEKGHVAGPELDGRTTAQDLGLGRMMSTKKAFIGQALAQRPGMTHPDRPALVGLQPVDRGARLRAGAHLVENPRTATSETSLGWVSSVGYSPALGHWIGLGFIRGGAVRHGEGAVAYHPLKDERVPVEITSPHFVDPEGERLRG